MRKERDQELVRDIVNNSFSSVVEDGWEDLIHEHSDSLVDIYNSDLINWIQSNREAVEYVDEAIESLGWPGNLYKAIQYGQFEYYRDLFYKELKERE